MGYQTKNILSVSAPSRVSTGLARGALLYAMPWLAVALMVLLAAMRAMPLFGTILAGLGMFYAPLLILSRRSNVSIDKNLNVSWTPATRPNHRLLKRSLGSLCLLVIFGMMFYLTG